MKCNVPSDGVGIDEGNDENEGDDEDEEADERSINDDDSDDGIESINSALIYSIRLSAMASILHDRMSMMGMIEMNDE